MGRLLILERAGKAVEMDRGPDQERLWERYMQIERRELEDRKNGELERVLGSALPGESQEEIDRIAREDREKAEAGLVGLRDGEEFWYKHIDELTPDDQQARIEAQQRRLAWVGERLGRAPGGSTSRSRD